MFEERNRENFPMGPDPRMDPRFMNCSYSGDTRTPDMQIEQDDLVFRYDPHAHTNPHPVPEFPGYPPMPERPVPPPKPENGDFPPPMPGMQGFPPPPMGMPPVSVHPGSHAYPQQPPVPGFPLPHPFLNGSTPIPDPSDLPGRYDTLPIEEKLLHKLRCLSHRLHMLSEGIAGQRRILTILSAVPYVSQRQLTELLGIRAASLSETMGKLENSGKIRRIPNPNDRRSWLVSITQAGMDEIKNYNPDTANDFFSELNKEERTVLLSLLEKLAPNPTVTAGASCEKNSDIC